MGGGQLSNYKHVKLDKEIGNYNRNEVLLMCHNSPFSKRTHNFRVVANEGWIDTVYFDKVTDKLK